MKTKVCGLSIIGGLVTKGLSANIYLNNQNRNAKYEIEVEGRIEARTDTEEKARMYLEAIEKGYDYGTKAVIKIV